MDYIKMNTSRLNGDAQSIAGLLQGIKTQLEQMKQSVNQLDSMWDGPGSEAFKKVFQDDMSAMAELLKNLESMHSYEVNAKTKYESCENKVGTIVAGIRI